MSLLLKSVWRNVLRSSPLNKSLGPRSLSSSAPEVIRGKTPDVVMTSIQKAPSAADVLAVVQSHMPLLTHKHMLQALRCLFELQKIGKLELETENILKDPTFTVLCQNFKKQARALEVGEAIEAVKVLTYLKVPADSLVVQTMLQIIRCDINMINLRQIMFVDFLLHRFDSKNHLVDALKLGLPLAFQIHMPLEYDNEDLFLLRDMLAYSCTHNLPDRCINNIVTGLLLHDQVIDAQTAKSIIWSLCLINCTAEVHPTRVQLLHICYDILTQHINQLPYDELLRTAARIKGRILEKHPEFYHEQLMDAVANYVIQNEVDFEKSLLVARILSRIAHTHMGLVEYLCQLAAALPSSLANARTNILLGFINCLSNNNYTPQENIWNELRGQISLNPVLNAKHSALPWTKICLELASLGHYEDKLLNRVFCKQFLEESLAKENNKLDYLQLLTLHEAVRAFHSESFKLPDDILETAKSYYPVHSMTAQVEEYLGLGLGGSEYVVRNVMLPCGFVADVLMYLKGGYPVKLPVCSGELKVPIERLNLPQGGVTVCVINFHQGCYSMNSNRLRGTFRLVLDILEHQGYATVPINVNEWLLTPPHSRTPYLMREVGYKCGEIGMKLSAT